MTSPYFISAEENTENFVVWFRDEGSPDHRMKWSGEVYPILKYSDGFAYYNEHRSEAESDKSKAKCMFSFSYCWRGVWEGRVYPQQTEYWGEDISIISELWDQIETLVRDKIKSDNLDYEFFD